MKDLIDHIKFNWNNFEGLELDMLTIVEKQLELAEKIASEEQRFDSAYLVEKSNKFDKSNESEIKARVRNLLGNNRTKYEYEFDALVCLLNVVTSRVEQLLDPVMGK